MKDLAVDKDIKRKTAPNKKNLEKLLQYILKKNTKWIQISFLKILKRANWEIVSILLNGRQYTKFIKE